jgi:predicted nucleic acid-binding protein
MILVDTSVWIEHLRARESRLVYALETEQILCPCCAIFRKLRS